MHDRNFDKIDLALNPGLERCARCGEVALGSAQGYDGERLCHGVARSCYTEASHERYLPLGDLPF